jgi:hypothetical protein
MLLALALTALLTTAHAAAPAAVATYRHPIETLEPNAKVLLGDFLERVALTGYSVSEGGVVPGSGSGANASYTFVLRYSAKPGLKFAPIRVEKKGGFPSADAAKAASEAYLKKLKKGSVPLSLDVRPAGKGVEYILVVAPPLAPAR